MLTAYATPAATMGDARRLDADAARLRIIQTVYVAAHGVSLAVREAAANGAPLSGLRAVGRHVDAIERVTGSYVQRHAAAFAGEHTMRPEAGTLAEALAQWNLTAHRALESDQVSTADVVGVARSNAALMLSTSVIIAAAGQAGLVNEVDRVTRISPGLETSVTAWMALAQGWQNSRLATSNPRASLDTLAAGNQLHQALHDITRDGSGWASPALIASRTDLAPTVKDLAHAATGVADIASRYVSLPGELARAGQLTLPARHLVELENRAYARRFADKVSTPELPVASSDLTQNRSVPPTPRLLAQLEALAQRIVTGMNASFESLAKTGRNAAKPELSRASCLPQHSRSQDTAAPPAARR